MAGQGSPDAERSDGTVADDARLRERKDRAGRISYITFAANSQRLLAKMSADIKLAGLDLEEAGVELTLDQELKLSMARTKVLDAADHLYALASQMVGELRKDNS